MNRTDFLNMIEHEVPVNRQMIGEVYELLDIFPYFQSAHMLLLKSLYDNADVKFENQLRNSAIHVCDREVLYWLLKTKAHSGTVKTDIKRGNDLNTEIVSDTQQTVIESAKNSEFMISEIEKNSDEARFLEKQDDLNRAHGHSVMVATEPDNTEPDGVTFLLEEDITPREDKIFFMDPGFSIPDHSDLLELDLDLDDSSTEISLDEDTNRKNLIREEEKTKKQSQSELIDKFIVANPRIEPHKDKSNIPADDISRLFVEEAGELVTETLARIYINQGYYSKAIDIYEKLSLKFPEKSSYFASQIEKVKEYIKK
jgi:tetratricopeptide (TPR) repeat protein